MAKHVMTLILLASLAGCASLPPNTRPVPKEMALACKQDPKGCVVLPVTTVESALEEAFNMGVMLGIMGGGRR